MIHKTKRRVFIGICEKSPQGNTNKDLIFVESEDGLFRCVKQPDTSYTLQEMLLDFENGYVKIGTPIMGL